MKKKIVAKSESQRMKKILLASVLALTLTLVVFGKSIFTNENEVKLSDATFENVVLKSDKLVMVDFWATWCGPCKMIAPTVKQLAIDYKGKIVVGKLDVDQNQVTAAQYGIDGIPAILFFKNGKLIDKQVGFVSKEVLENKIKAHL